VVRPGIVSAGRIGRKSSVAADASRNETRISPVFGRLSPAAVVGEIGAIAPRNKDDQRACRQKRCESERSANHGVDYAQP
jgi:hypothetical protein